MDLWALGPWHWWREALWMLPWFPLALAAYLFAAKTLGNHGRTLVIAVVFFAALATFRLVAPPDGVVYDRHVWLFALLGLVLGATAWWGLYCRELRAEH
jgi:hypothetical protein